MSKKGILSGLTYVAERICEDENMTDYQFCQKLKDSLDEVEILLLEEEADADTRRTG